MKQNIVKQLALDVKKPEHMFALMNAVQLASARIHHNNAIRAAKALKDAGWVTPADILNKPYWDKVRMMNQNGYARYDEKTPYALDHNAKLVRDKYKGDLTALLKLSPRELKEAVQEFRGIGPAGAEIFHRELKPHLKKANVLAHIAGPSGSGKTTLLQQISKNYPNIQTKDLDDFDQQGESELGFNGVHKDKYTHTMLKQLANKRQQLMNKYLQQYKSKPIVLGGHHWEDKHILDIPTKQRFMLDTGAYKSAWRGYLRDDTRKLSDLPYDVKINKEDINKLQQMGYQKITPAQVLQYIAKEAAAKQQQTTQTVQKTRLPTAVIIKGNPRWIKGNKLADKFYNQIADHFRKHNYAVTFDAGKRFSEPAKADIWVGHSRGADRLRFAPKETKTIDLTPFEHHVSQLVMQRQDAIRRAVGVERVKDLPPELQLRPPPHHYFFTNKMKQHITAVIDEKAKRAKRNTTGPFGRI